MNENEPHLQLILALTGLKSQYILLWIGFLRGNGIFDTTNSLISMPPKIFFFHSKSIRHQIPFAAQSLTHQQQE
jgi:hypothetical protein